MKRILGYFDAAGKVVAAVSAVVALVSGVVGLVFLLSPSSKHSAGPSTVVARIDEISSQGTTTYGQFLSINEQSPTSEQLAKQGTVGHYYVLKLTLRGLQNKDVVVLWSLYNAGNNSPIVREHWINQSATPVRAVADDAVQVTRVWIQRPTFRGRFYARIDLALGKTTLDSKPTDLFVGLQAPVAPVVRPDAVVSLPLGPRTKHGGCTRGTLPDRACSPGAIYNQLTKNVICGPAFRTSFYANTPEAQRFAVQQEYGIPAVHYGRLIEVDHIVSIELGGSNDIANLFPESEKPRPGYHEKDRVENYLHDQVCRGAMTLAAAQRAIATDWVQVYRTMR